MTASGNMPSSACNRAIIFGELPPTFKDWCEAFQIQPVVMPLGDGYNQIVFEDCVDMLLFGMKFGWCSCEFS